MPHDPKLGDYDSTYAKRGGIPIRFTNEAESPSQMIDRLMTDSMKTFCLFQRAYNEDFLLLAKKWIQNRIG